MRRFFQKLLLTLIMVCLLTQSVSAAQLLIPVGQVIGVALEDQTVTVAAFDEDLGAAAKAAGLQVGDRIDEIDGMQIRSVEDVHTALTRSDGTVVLRIQRSGKQKQLKLTPEITERGPKIGIYLRQGITGIGTVTWYDPHTRKFGALGHGVSTQDGALVEATQGTAYRAAVTSVKKGQPGNPGQLIGTLESREPIGVLEKNTQQGIFGETETGWQGLCLPTARPEQVRTGDATIRATVQGRTVQEYSVEILKIYPTNRTNGRNMLLRITDPELLTITGGIVQGMSGSPIIQDGKLIGAVTHVLVNDPTTGYGIFIENMLDAAA